MLRPGSRSIEDWQRNRFASERRVLPKRRALTECLAPSHAESEGHPCPDLACGLAIDAGAAQPKIDGNVVLDLPDRSDESGTAPKRADVAFVKDFGDRSHGPVMRTLDNAVEKVIGMLLASKLNLGVEVDRSPVPALGDDTVRTAPVRGCVKTEAFNLRVESPS